MGKNDGDIGELIAVFVFVFFGLPAALNGFQRAVELVDKLVSFSNTISYPYNILVGVAAIVLFIQAVKVLESRLRPGA